jgi:hypothetical protein
VTAARQSGAAPLSHLACPIEPSLLSKLSHRSSQLVFTTIVPDTFQCSHCIPFLLILSILATIFHHCWPVPSKLRFSTGEMLSIHAAAFLSTNSVNSSHGILLQLILSMSVIEFHYTCSFAFHPLHSITSVPFHFNPCIP